MSKAMQPDGIVINLTEDSRTYIFPVGEVRLENIVQVIIRPSGSHRVRTTDGKLHFISSGFLAITIVDESTKGWTV